MHHADLHHKPFLTKTIYTNGTSTIEVMNCIQLWLLMEWVSSHYHWRQDNLLIFLWSRKCWGHLVNGNVSGGFFLVDDICLLFHVLNFLNNTGFTKAPIGYVLDFRWHDCREFAFQLSKRSNSSICLIMSNICSKKTQAV